jgi:hypothetical protein
MVDQAPESTRYLRRMLGFERALSGIDLSTLEITTVIAHGDKRMAESTVTRPYSHIEKVQHEWDQGFYSIFRDLPGYDGLGRISMGRTYTVTWDGVRAPI